MKQGHYLLISLRNQDTCVPLMVPSRQYALDSIAFVSVTFLRKHPNDRAGVWMLGGPRVDTVISDAGVGDQVRHEFLAAFDPRDIIAITYREVYNDFRDE